MKSNLIEYNKKRDFTKTNEPVGNKIKRKSKKLKFVIQYHEARKKHYDLRLEYDGVYKSFAVPKGLSYNPKDKRLAILVEDHPLSYGNFEGNIPKGNYGAGTVMLFDKGYWTYDYTPNFNDGPIKFELKGKRLNGKWSLVKMDEDNWLIIKEKEDKTTKKDITKFKTSIKSGKTIDEIRKNKEKLKIPKITNPDKIIIKDGNITKEDIFNYYMSVEKKIMPFLGNRLISTIRCPDGKDKFYMKHLNNKSKNLGIKRIKDKNDESSDYYYIKNIVGLLEEVQMNSYEFHIWNSKQNNINKPNILIFDLDPDESISLKKLREGVQDLKEILDEFHLKSYLKTSGGKGYHIYVPLHASSYKSLEKIAKNISLLLVNKYPEKYTINMRMKSRKNKIFIDFLRNKKGATSVSPYSIRLKPNAPISCPISWEELDTIKPNEITIKNYKNRARKNPWKDFFK